MSIFNRKKEENLMQVDPGEMEMKEEQYLPDSRDNGKSGGVGIRSFSDFRSSEYFMMVISLILALLLLLTSGLLIYKTHALSVENSKLENRLQRDNKLKKSEAEYETETENLQIETDSLINRYGTGSTPEKTILFLANLSSTSGISVTSIEFGESGNAQPNESSKNQETTTKSSEPADKEKKNGKGKNASTPLGLDKYQVTMSYTGTYAQLKKAINFIEDYGERTTVNDLTSTYDETTNQLTGSMTLNMYTLSGTGQKYTEPSVTGSVGNSNIFG